MKNKINSPLEILFLFPGFRDETFLNFILDYHLGVGYILAYLKEKGITARQFIYKDPINLDTLTDKVLEQNPKIVGFTVYDTNYYFVKLICQRLKKKNPKLLILAGGPTATFSDKLIMKDSPSIDICVRGEGEYTVYELIQNLKKEQGINNIQGITYRLDGNLVQTPDRPLIKGPKEKAELDILPSPYLNDIFPEGENFGILTSRGCIYKCIYCNFSAMSRWTIRYHSVDRVISELRILYKSFQSKNTQIENRFVEVYDDTFSLNMERAKQISHRIIEGKIHLLLRSDTRADKVNRELLYLMYQAGFREINFGLESAVPRILKNIKKVRTKFINKKDLKPERNFIQKVKENVKLAKKVGIEPTVSVILGLPGSTPKDDKKTIEFVSQLKIGAYYHDYLRICSGTELFKIYTRYGLGIKQPLTVLPYQTEYAYDVYKIPKMENSLQEFSKRNQMEKVMEIITGDYGNSQGDGYPDLLFRNCTLDSKTIDWLGRIMAISPALCFLNSHFESRNLYQEQVIAKIVSAGLPILNFWLLESLNKEGDNSCKLDFASGKYVITPAIEILTHRRQRFSRLDFLKFIPFADYVDNGLAMYDMKNKGIENIVFSLSTFDDIENLSRLTSSSKKVIFGGDIVKFDCYFLDVCKWTNTDCPAVRFRRAIIENDGSIIPCFNGKPIAKVGDEQRDIIQSLRLMWSEMKKKRGCDDCLTKDNCAKCLFPYPLEPKEYCRIRRRKFFYTQMEKVFNLFKVIRRLRFFNHDMRLKSKDDKIAGIFDHGLVLIDIGRKRYLYDCRFDRSYVDLKSEAKNGKRL